ncbi:hypothetical protein Tco_0633292 [Tanacetum coccineum]
MFLQFESGGASGSGGCEDDEESADDQEDEDEDGDGDRSNVLNTYSDFGRFRTFSSDMSPRNMCHGGTNYLTEKYVGPTLSLGIVAGERIPSEHSPATIPQQQVARERYPQRQVAGESPKMLLGIAVNVVVEPIGSPRYTKGKEPEAQPVMLAIELTSSEETPMP